LKDIDAARSFKTSVDNGSWREKQREIIKEGYVSPMNHPRTDMDYNNITLPPPFFWGGGAFGYLVLAEYYCAEL